jgi:hypothetical protein
VTEPYPIGHTFTAPRSTRGPGARTTDTWRVVSERLMTTYAVPFYWCQCETDKRAKNPRPFHESDIPEKQT